jgi:inorganic pyrophosphatase
MYTYNEEKPMNIPGISPGNYLEILPLNKLAKYTGGPPKNGVPFTGYPQQHPGEKDKIILVYDPLGSSPAVLEFKLDDILFVEDVHSAVTEQGEGVPLMKLWIRRGARGMVLDPFEVDEPVRFLETARESRERFLQQKAAGETPAARTPAGESPGGRL